MIDLSDGLASDADHVARASDVTLFVELDRLPLADGLVEVARELGVDPRELGAAGGEDYELCVCVAPEGRTQAEAAADITWVGRVEPGGPGARFFDERGERTLAGFEHVA
jgi:thiamine-monophosphate kinase